MPLVDVVSSVSWADGTTYEVGEQVQVDGDLAHSAVADGWGQLVRELPAETPEAATARRRSRPERRDQP